MRVAIAGVHGKIALRVTRLLAQRGDEVRSLIRKAEQAGDVRVAGAEPVLADLEKASEDELAAAIGAGDAVVFAAGAGSGSGPDRKWTMDYGSAVKVSEAAKRAGTHRYLMPSSLGGRGRGRATELPPRLSTARHDPSRALRYAAPDMRPVGTHLPIQAFSVIGNVVHLSPSEEEAPLRL